MLFPCPDDATLQVFHEFLVPWCNLPWLEWGGVHCMVCKCVQCMDHQKIYSFLSFQGMDLQNSMLPGLAVRGSIFTNSTFSRVSAFFDANSCFVSSVSEQGTRTPPCFTICFDSWKHDSSVNHHCMQIIRKVHPQKITDTEHDLENPP